MGDINALVVFYSRSWNGREARARGGAWCDPGRRQHPPAPSRRSRATKTTIEADRDWKTNLDRMNRDYVVPRPADPVWADIIILATPADSSTELEAYVASLSSLGSMTGKIAAPLAPGNRESTLKPIYSAVGVLWPDRRALRRHGRRPDRERAIIRSARHRDGARDQAHRVERGLQPPRRAG